MYVCVCVYVSERDDEFWTSMFWDCMLVDGLRFDGGVGGGQGALYEWFILFFYWVDDLPSNPIFPKKKKLIWKKLFLNGFFVRSAGRGF